MFTTVRTHLKDVNRWSISQYEELVNNLSSNHRSASLFWDLNCCSEFLTILVAEQNLFYSFWKPISPKVLKMLLQIYHFETVNSFDNGNRDQFIMQIDPQEFQDKINKWRRSSGITNYDSEESEEIDDQLYK